MAVCWGVQEERQRGQVHGQSAASSGQGRERPLRAPHQESLKQASFPYREIIIRHVNSVGGGSYFFIPHFCRRSFHLAQIFAFIAFQS